MVALLTTNSFPFPFPHKIIRGLDVHLYPIEISYFVFFTEKEKRNYPAVLTDERNIHYRHKVFQVPHESWDCTQSIWIVFFFSLCNFHCGRKKKKEILITVAINHKNLYYHTALQAVHSARNKSRDSFIQKDNLMAVFYSLCKSRYA